jgi:hypothetical protein
LYPDSAYDPIASYEAPFRGDFFLSGNFFGYKSATITQDLSVFGETTRLDTNVFITSATDIFVTNVTDATPALQVTQFGGISGAPIARFIGNIAPGKDTGEFTINFDRLGQVGIGTTAPREILHIQQQSATKNGVILLETISNSSILRLESFDNGAIHFAKTGETPLVPYAIIEGDSVGSLTIKSSLQNTVTYIDSPNGNSILFERIKTSDPAAKGGLTVATSTTNLGSIFIDGTQSIRLQPGDTETDALVAYSNRDVHLTANLAVTGSTTIRENLTVNGDSTNLNTNVFITSAVNVVYTGSGDVITVDNKGSGQSITTTQSNSSSISTFTNTISSAIINLQSLSGSSLIRQSVGVNEGNTAIGGLEISTTATTSYPTVTAMGSFTADLSGAVRISSRLNPNAIAVIPDDANGFYESKTGIGLDTPNKQLTVKGEISATSFIWDPDGYSAQWNSVYTTVRANSSNWESVYTSVRQTSAIWDTVVLRLPLSGGTLSGLLKLQPQDGPDALKIWGDVTIYGNLSSTGLQSFANTIFTTTSSISVVNDSSATALTIRSKGTGDIASFYDADTGTEVLHIGGTDSTYPYVGINTSTPNVEFTVVGRISSTDVIYALSGSSTNWNSVYQTVRQLSGVWGPGQLADYYIATTSVDNNCNLQLDGSSTVQEIIAIATGVTTISSFSNNFRGHTYTLTNYTSANINILQTPAIFIRQGHSWRATASSYTNSFLTLPISGSCCVHFDSKNSASVW